MNITDYLFEEYKGVLTKVKVDKNAELNGQKAVEVTADLINGMRVVGTFTTESKPGFGGVDFAGPKDIAGLMSSKIDSVLRGTHDATEV